MVKKAFLTLLAVGVFVLVGCGASGPEKADSIEDIVGTELCLLPAGTPKKG